MGSTERKAKEIFRDSTFSYSVHSLPLDSFDFKCDSYIWFIICTCEPYKELIFHLILTYDSFLPHFRNLLIFLHTNSLFSHVMKLLNMIYYSCDFTNDSLISHTFSQDI